jgi:hypothetical protein
MMPPDKLSKRVLIKTLFFFSASLTCSTKARFISLVKAVQEKLEPSRRPIRKRGTHLEL